MLLLSPEGRILDSFRASGQVARDAILQHSAALQAAEAPPQLPLAPEAQGEELIPLDGSNSGTSSTGSNNGSNGSSNTPDKSSTTAAAADSRASGSTPGSTASTARTTAGQTATAAAEGGRPACSTAPEPACAPQVAGNWPAPNSTSSVGNHGVSLQQAKQQFLAQYGSVYGYSGWLEANYQQEVGNRLQGRHYLDYTGQAGGGLLSSWLRACR